jgi:hypothetical protein
MMWPPRCTGAATPQRRGRGAREVVMAGRRRAACARVQAGRARCDPGLGEGDTWPHSPALLIRREASHHGQPACRGGLPPQSPQNEAMEHEGQRDGESGYHDQRIG